jgi:hypothetical protein
MKLTAKIPQMRRKGHPFQAHFVYFSLFPNMPGRQEGDRGRFFVSLLSPQILPGSAFLTDTVFSCIIIITNITKFLNLDAFLYQKGLFYAGYSQAEWHEKSNEKDGSYRTLQGICRAPRSSNGAFAAICLCPGGDAERLFARNGHARSNGC